MSSSSSNQKVAHVALLPSAGMGHLIPFLRLASSLSLHNVKVTIITPIPTVSLSESHALTRFFVTFPQITQLLLPLHHHHHHSNNPTNSSLNDPFYNHMETIHHSSHLLHSLLPSLSPPLCALITDMSLTSSLLPITHSLNLPNYILFTSSAKMLTLFVYYHSIMDSISAIDSLRIPGLEPIPKSWIPPPLLENTENSLKTYIAENGKKMAGSSGILVNTFESIEKESLSAVGVVAILPPVIAIGPSRPLIEKREELKWLGRQPAGSVVYVSFGSRTAMSREQVRELGEGLVKSGFRFVWVVKDKKVDAEDKQVLDEIIGSGLMEKRKENGLVTKNWVDQEEVLGHESVGCFVSHCGWNSVTEAMWNGVRVLAWPQSGDQKINAAIVEKIGLGIWDKRWGWGGETVVNGADIAEKIKGLMGNEMLREKALSIREEARKAVEFDGTSDKRLRELIKTWKQAPTLV